MPSNHQVLGSGSASSLVQLLFAILVLGSRRVKRSPQVQPRHVVRFQRAQHGSDERLALAIERVPIGKRLGIAGIVAAVLPFGPFVVDRWLGALAERG